MIRVRLPSSLRVLAKIEGEVLVEVPGPATCRSVLEAVERAHPALRGTIRDQRTGERRPFLRYFACSRDLSHDPDEAPLPVAVARGDEPFLVVGAMAGG